MIQRLRELQCEEAQNNYSSTQTPNNLPQDSQVDGTQNLSDQQDKTEKETGTDVEQRKGGCEESSRTAPNATSEDATSSTGQKHAACSSSGDSGSARLFPDFIYQASPDTLSWEMDGRQGRRGGRKCIFKENGRKAKQKMNFSSTPHDEANVQDDSDQQVNTTSWSEMSSMVIGSEYSLSPLSRAMEQRLILQYLTPLGDYQEVRTCLKKTEECVVCVP